MKTKSIGIIGCGNISSIYFNNLTNMFRNVRVHACADMDAARAAAKAAEFPGVKALTVDELLADPEIDIVVNLTIPSGHFEVAYKAVSAGKSVYSEKPLTLTREEGKTLLQLAEKKGVRVGAAPDTFLGGGIQTCLKLIRDGAIGEPVGAQAFMMSHGPEGWHPDPEFFYKSGGGPMFDMGPYYLTAMVALLGPVKQTTGVARISHPTRTITSEKKKGQSITVEIPTHIAGVLDFCSGAVGTICTSFDVWSSEVPHIEIFGSEGTLSVPDPNTFGGPVRLREAGSKEWVEIPLTHGFSENSRSLGLADMALAMDQDRPHRASGELAFHVLDLMHSFHDASEQGRHIELQSTCACPEPMPENPADSGLI